MLKKRKNRRGVHGEYRETRKCGKGDCLLLYKDLTDKIIGSAIEVRKILGNGFLEKVYENALVIELRNRNLLVEVQKPINVFFKGKVVGSYFADILVEDKVIIELKCVERLQPIHKAQLLNYLKATGKELGLMINFGNSKVEIKRIINKIIEDSF